MDHVCAERFRMRGVALRWRCRSAGRAVGSDIAVGVGVLAVSRKAGGFRGNDVTSMFGCLRG